MFSDIIVFDDDENDGLNDELDDMSNDARPWMLFLVLMPFLVKLRLE